MSEARQRAIASGLEHLARAREDLAAALVFARADLKGIENGPDWLAQYRPLRFTGEALENAVHRIDLIEADLRD